MPRHDLDGVALAPDPLQHAFSPDGRRGFFLTAARHATERLGTAAAQQRYWLDGD
jgi:hypothetical protein